MTGCEKWWSHSRAFARLAPTEQRRAIADNAGRLARRRIADLPTKIGRSLDDFVAPFRVHRWVAYAPGKPGPARDARRLGRYNAIRKFYDERARWPTDAEFCTLDPELAEASVPPFPDPAIDTNGQLRRIDPKGLLLRECARQGVPPGEAQWLTAAFEHAGITAIAYETRPRETSEGEVSH